MSAPATEAPIDLAPDDLVALLERIEPLIDPADCACIRALAQTVLDVSALAQRQKATIRDLRALLNPKPEGLANLTSQQATDTEGSEDDTTGTITGADASEGAPEGADDTPAFQSGLVRACAA